MSQIVEIVTDGKEILIGHVCDFCGNEFPVNSHLWYGSFDNREACYDCRVADMGDDSHIENHVSANCKVGVK